MWFLQLVKQELNLDFEIINDLASNLQAKFDYITARAVGNLDFYLKSLKIAKSYNYFFMN